MIGGGGQRITVAAGIAAVEAMKDQLGICRWNYSLNRSKQFVAREIAAYRASAKMSSADAAEGESGAVVVDEGSRNMEGTIGKVMELSCWGPTTVRF